MKKPKKVNNDARDLMNKTLSRFNKRKQGERSTISQVPLTRSTSKGESVEQNPILPIAQPTAYNEPHKIGSITSGNEPIAAESLVLPKTSPLNLNDDGDKSLVKAGSKKRSLGPEENDELEILKAKQNSRVTSKNGNNKELPPFSAMKQSIARPPPQRLHKSQPLSDDIFAATTEKASLNVALPNSQQPSSQRSQSIKDTPATKLTPVLQAPKTQDLASSTQNLQPPSSQKRPIVETSEKLLEKEPGHSAILLAIACRCIEELTLSNESASKLTEELGHVAALVAELEEAYLSENKEGLRAAIEDLRKSAPIEPPIAFEHCIQTQRFCNIALPEMLRQADLTTLFEFFQLHHKRPQGQYTDVNVMIRSHKSVTNTPLNIIDTFIDSHMPQKAEERAAELESYTAMGVDWENKRHFTRGSKDSEI